MVVDMLSGKKERELLEELENIKQQNEKRGGILKEICNQKNHAVEQFHRAAASCEKMEKDIDQVKEQLSQFAKFSESSDTAASDIHSEIIKMNNTVESFDANHSVFIGQMKQQNEKLMEVLEENKKISAPADCISEIPASLQSQYDDIRETLEEMRDFSKSMSVLSLNAAIEAGRLGESGSRFITAAEEVRNFAEKYDEAARTLSEQLNRSMEHVQELEKQTEQLKQSVREHSMAMGRLATGYMQGLTSYESNQLELHGMIQESLIGRSDTMVQFGHEAIRLKDHIVLQIDNVREELVGQKETVNELERLGQKLQQAAEHELSK